MKSVEQQFTTWFDREYPAASLLIRDALRGAFDAGRRSIRAELRRHTKATTNAARKARKDTTP